MGGLWLLAVAGVVTGSLLPAGSPEMQAIAKLHVSDKLLHFVAYGVLACVPGWMESRRMALAVCAGLLGLGGLMEVLQPFVPGRACDVLDGVADLGGVVCGFLVSAGAAAWWGRIRRSAA